MIELVFIITLVIGFYAAWNIGANDVSNAMGTSVGSKALTLRQAVIIAAVFEFLGAVLYGSNVSETLQKGIVNTEVFASSPDTLLYGMIAALLATGIWLQLATYLGLPVSTTHSIVGAIVGFGAIIGGVDAVFWMKAAAIACSWLVSPLVGAVISYCIFTYLRKQIFYQLRPLEATKRSLPWIVFCCTLVLSLFTVYEMHNLEVHFFRKLLIICVLATVAAVVTYLLLAKFQAPYCPIINQETNPILLREIEKARKSLLRIQRATAQDAQFQTSDVLEELDSLKYSLKQKELDMGQSTEFFWVEKFFGYLQVLSACLMAFSHGANDVANAIGPLAAALSIIQTGSVFFSSSFPPWILVFGGIGIIAGLATWGWRVIETIGKKITELTPSRGFSAEFGAALTILTASALGFPISTTHTLVGSVLGVGMAGGIGALNLRVIRDICISWVITIPAGAFLCIVCYWALSYLA